MLPLVDGQERRRAWRIPNHAEVVEELQVARFHPGFRRASAGDASSRSATPVHMRILLWILASAIVLVSLPVCAAAVRGNEAMYVGGTLAGVSEKTEGRLDLSGEQAAKFVWNKGSSSIQYKKNNFVGVWSKGWPESGRCPCRESDCSLFQKAQTLRHCRVQ